MPGPRLRDDRLPRGRHFLSNYNITEGVYRRAQTGSSTTPKTRSLAGTEFWGRGKNEKILVMLGLKTGERVSPLAHLIPKHPERMLMSNASTAPSKKISSTTTKIYSSPTSSLSTTNSPSGSSSSTPSDHTMHSDSKGQ